MKFSTIIAAATAAYASAEELTRCGNLEPPEEVKTKLNKAVEAFTNSRASANETAGAAGAVDTYVHIVTTSAKEGSYSQQQVNEQVGLLAEQSRRTES